MRVAVSKPSSARAVSDRTTAVEASDAHGCIYMEAEPHLTDLQLAVVRVLWDRGESTVIDVQDALLPERRLAQTTVATILSRLEKRGVVHHRTVGRQFFYRAQVTEPQVRRSMVSELTALLFDGSPAALISHLLADRHIAARDLAEVKRLIAQAEDGSNASAVR
jgi:BlaI family transcriptional regulator, penicillinase repressor